MKYLPFGGTRSGSVPTDKKPVLSAAEGFTGQRLDATGLYYYGARYYDATIGRFLSPDSASPDLYLPQSFNKYSCCFNNPLKYNDPTGNWPSLGKLWHKIKSGASAVVNVVKDNIHSVLDVAGMIPVVGEAFDAVNGLMYAVEGDAVNAALSFAACIPVIGTAATGVKLITKVDKVVGAFKAVDKAGDITDAIKSSSHHILTNKNNTWTPLFEKVTKQYDLDLKGDWNIIPIAQKGRHPNAYHDWAYKNLLGISDEAAGDSNKFLDLFNQRIKTPVQNNPSMIYAPYWRP